MLSSKISRPSTGVGLGMTVVGNGSTNTSEGGMERKTKGASRST